jgi:Holliday junction DNA helicase RuvA
MIARLRGVVDGVAEASCVIDVNGVGYLVFASARTLGALPAEGIATLLIETQVREDAIALYGFATGAERDWFRLLTTVQGVGAKVALALLSALSPDQLIAAIATGDRAMLTRSPGVGAKLAMRLVSELREKVGAMPAGGVVVPTFAEPAGAAADAVSALLNLGYRRPEAEAALAGVAAQYGPDAALDVLIRGGLKALAK